MSKKYTDEEIKNLEAHVISTEIEKAQARGFWVGLVIGALIGIIVMTFIANGLIDWFFDSATSSNLILSFLN